MLVVSETKLKGTGQWIFGNVVGRVSGVSDGNARGGSAYNCGRKLEEVCDRM